MKPSQKSNNGTIEVNQSKKTTLIKFIFFIIINFSGLYFGGLFTNQAVTAEWYTSLNKSSITPPGWFFGFAWTTIMVCLAIFMTAAYNSVINKKKLLTVYGVQWILNFLWNPLFFYMHQVNLALVNIVSLALLVTFMILIYCKEVRWKTFLLLPYAMWIYVASYLNLFILLNN